MDPDGVYPVECAMFLEAAEIPERTGFLPWMTDAYIKKT
jgi:hypothetical protein